MSKNASELAKILPPKGSGDVAEGSEGRLVKKKFPSDNLVSLGLKVPAEFRKKLRMIAAERELTAFEIFRDALELYEKKFPSAK